MQRKRSLVVDIAALTIILVAIYYVVAIILSSTAQLAAGSTSFF